MSRIWKLPIELSDKVQASMKDQEITIKWPLGELKFTHNPKVEVIIEATSIIVKPLGDEANALWGTTRSILNNMVIGVTTGYKESLEIIGVWYKFEVQGKDLILSIWYSHKVNMPMPSWVTIALDEKLKNVLHISGIDKQLVGEIASKIRSKKKPEPYKGKWIKYVGEQIRRKAGKTGSK